MVIQSQVDICASYNKSCKVCDPKRIGFQKYTQSQVGT